jgi:hypothetical protein
VKPNVKATYEHPHRAIYNQAKQPEGHHIDGTSKSIDDWSKNGIDESQQRDTNKGRGKVVYTDTIHAGTVCQLDRKCHRNGP